MLKTIIINLILSFLIIDCAFAVNVPDIPLKGFTGKVKNVNEYIGKGKWVVVAVWSHDCPLCNKEIHHLESFHKKNKQKGIVTLGVSIDGWAKRAQVAEFIKRHALTFVNLIAEPEQATMKKFGAGKFVGTPTYYFYEPEGSLMDKYIGPLEEEDLYYLIDTMKHFVEIQ